MKTKFCKFRAVLIITLTNLLISSSVFAQTPNKMSYQAVIRDSYNNLIANSQIGMEINILQDSPTGTIVYTETQTPTTDDNGLVSIEIGGSIGFDTINWASGTYFLEINIAVVPPLTTYTITGVSQLLSVPYAFHANTADSIVGGIPFSGFNHYIGEYFGGGIIYHLWKDSLGIERGLIVDIVEMADWFSPQEWSNVHLDFAGASSLWDGLNNSNTIVGQLGHTSSAAALCLNSTNGGQSDWYLPSINELTLLWSRSFDVNKTLSTLSGATDLSPSSNYWSSTEMNNDGAWSAQYILKGSFPMFNKSAPQCVRCIRAF